MQVLIATSEMVVEGSMRRMVVVLALPLHLVKEVPDIPIVRGVG